MQQSTQNNQESSELGANGLMVGDEEFMSIVSFCSARSKNLSFSAVRMLHKKIERARKKYDISTELVVDEIYGPSRLYPIAALHTCWNQVIDEFGKLKCD